jgi:RNA-directed DNA polymerase
VFNAMTMCEAMRQMPASAGRVPEVSGEAARARTSDEALRPRHETENTGSALLLAALTRENLQQAWKRVRANKGAAGVDGRDIPETARYLKIAWPEIREQLLQGTYRPSPVRRVTIPKPNGGERELGIPTVTDRLIQQALLQVLQPILDPTFSKYSFGFRPGRSAQEAVVRAQAYVQSGCRIVVDVDLEKFFDRVNHDILIGRLQKRIGDAGVIRLVRAYLNSGIMRDGIVVSRYQGTPQGGPLSPLLANVLLDEVDKELERRGDCFVRYADDANVYVRSQRAGERVMALLRKMYAKLHLTVNETKSAVASAFGRKFLGFSFWLAPKGEIKCGGGDQAAGDLQAADQATDPTLWWSQHGGSRGTTAPLCVGLESLLPVIANSERLANAGRVDAAPVAGDSAQALETWHDDVPGIESAGRVGSCGA